MTNVHVQVLPEKLKYQVKVVSLWQINIKDETKKFY